jgi:hypothetical protein
LHNANLEDFFSQIRSSTFVIFFPNKFWSFQCFFHEGSYFLFLDYPVSNNGLCELPFTSFCHQRKIEKSKFALFNVCLFVIVTKTFRILME